MNNLNIKNFKGAIIQYTCEDCLFGDNFTISFSHNPKPKSTECQHYIINFFLNNENRYKYILSLKCKKCNKNKEIELLDNNINETFKTITYICPNCLMGRFTSGFLLDNDSVGKIDLIFCYKGKEYNVYVDTNIYIPEAFSQLYQKYNEFRNLDIKYYKKGEEELSEFVSIEDLNLKNGEIINIIERENCEYEQK